MNSWMWSYVGRASSLSLLVLALLIPVVGCFERPTSNAPAAKESADSDSGNETENNEVFEELVKYDPPSLDEIDASANWVDRPLKEVRDPLVERLKDSPPLVPAEEAMSLKNDSPEANDKIYSVMRQLPESDEQVDADATWVHFLNGDLKSLNPLMISASVEMELLDLTGVALIGFDADFNWFGLKSTIKSWQTSEDQMMDKFVLRDDLYWSDGEPVTAHDFVFSFQTIMNPKVTIPAVRSSTQKLKWVEAYDDHTLVFFHKKPLASNSGNISYPVVPEHIYKDSLADDYTMENSKYHQQFINKPLTCGPYEYKSRARGQNIILTRRDDYWQKDGKQIREKPYFKEIRCEVITDPNTALLTLKTGDIDDCRLNAEQWLTQTDNADFYEKNTKVRGMEWTEFHIVWNVKRPYFEDKNVRKAMAFAFDHQEMLSSIHYNLAPAGLGAFHPTGWMASDKPKAYERNLDAAEDLLDEAGWDDSDGDGIRDKEVNGRLIPFRFTLLSSTTPNSIKICTQMKSNLDQIGIQVDVKPMEFTVLQDKSLKHQFDAMIAGWGSGADPSTLENVFGTGGGRNYGEYSNTRVDKLFEQGELEFDREKRAEYYSEIHEILWDDQPYLWLFYRPTLYGLNKEIRGFNFSPRDPFGVSPGIHGIWKMN
ncbi:ABC transporter substrate-binding protein [Aeoliella mucimassa]|uniref:Oligopeptide-binding protein AppA n=1 Tax=Aeoliella mucimassa TaxID=2527972 RepID=A0A518AHU1_9BACT|nr:ABC transporter substrate-binding protein [Aeoliella mucimassa]QDU54293.1 Oligopeptide-binding protein AppA precursor [Aeoliella mucimassa]